MKNKYWASVRRGILYVPDFRPFAGSVTASILWQQLDFWFAQYPDGFFKFLEPCKHEAYRNGDSWVEELGFSKDEFRTAFRKIGIVYKSKKDYNQAKDKFDGQKFFCSYHDKIKGLTWYLRNHNLADNTLNTFIKQGVSPVNRESQSTEIGNADLRRSGIPTYVNRESRSTKYITETTTENTTTTGTTPEKIPAKTSSSLDFDKWPCSQYHKKCFNRLFNDLNDASLAQSIIDYVMERHGKGKVNNFSGYVKTIVDKANSGDFGPLETTEPEEIITNPAKCKYCDSKGKMRFMRENGTLTELIKCKHGNQAHQYIQEVKAEYGFDLYQPQD